MQPVRKRTSLRDLTGINPSRAEHDFGLSTSCVQFLLASTTSPRSCRSGIGGFRPGHHWPVSEPIVEIGPSAFQCVSPTPLTAPVFYQVPFPLFPPSSKKEGPVFRQGPSLEGHPRLGKKLGIRTGLLPADTTTLLREPS